MPYDDVLELWHVLVHYISLRSEILRAINIKTADCRIWQCIFQRTCCLTPYPEDRHSRCPQQNIFTNLLNQAGSHLRRPVLKLVPCFTVCPLQAKSYSASKVKGWSTHSAQLPAQTAIWNSQYNVGCPFISIQLVVSDTLYARSDLCSWLL
jgi:hypothetical protein